MTSQDAVQADEVTAVDPLRNLVEQAAVEALAAGPEMRQRLVDYRAGALEAGYPDADLCASCLLDADRPLDRVATAGRCAEHDASALATAS